MILLKQRIQLDCTKAVALAVAIQEKLQSFAFLSPTGTDKLTVSQVLSIRYLVKLQARLFRRSATAKQHPKPKPFHFDFTPEEIIAIRTCISNAPGNFILQKVLGDIHQRSTNFNYLVEI